MSPLLETFVSLAETGNPFAVLACARLVVADDMDAEARAVLLELSDLLIRLYEADTAEHQRCWRCDATQAETDVGLCDACLRDLQTVSP